MKVGWKDVLLIGYIKSVNGLEDFIDKINYSERHHHVVIDRIRYIEMDERDVQRSEVVSQILEIYKKFLNIIHIWFVIFKYYYFTTTIFYNISSYLQRKYPLNTSFQRISGCGKY